MADSTGEGEGDQGNRHITWDLGSNGRDSELPHPAPASLSASKRKDTVSKKVGTGPWTLETKPDRLDNISRSGDHHSVPEPADAASPSRNILHVKTDFSIDESVNRKNWQDDDTARGTSPIGTPDTIPLVEKNAPDAEKAPSSSQGGEKKRVRWQEEPEDREKDRDRAERKARRRQKKRHITPFSTRPLVAPLDLPDVPPPPLVVVTRPALEEAHEEPVNLRRQSDGAVAPLSSKETQDGTQDGTQEGTQDQTQDGTQDPAWDAALQVPVEPEDVCSPTCARRAETGLKVALVSALFLLVLGGASIHQVTFLLMTNQLWTDNRWYACLPSVGEGATCLPLSWVNGTKVPTCVRGAGLYYREGCPAVAARWAWGLLLVIIVPDLLVTLRCLFYWCTESAIGGTGGRDEGRRAMRAYLAVLTVETIQAVGVSLMTFVVLPLLHSDIHRVALLSCTALVPSLINVVLPSHGYQRSCDVTAFVCQLTGLVIWPAIIGAGVMDVSIHLTWSIPMSLIFVSVPYFFNYYDSPATSKTADLLVPGLPQLRADVYARRNSIYLVTSVWKGLLHLALMALLTSLTYKGFNVFHTSMDGCAVDQLKSSDIPGLGMEWVWVLLVNLLAGFVCYFAARTASKICAQTIAYAVPLMLAPLLVFIFYLASCEANQTNLCFWTDLMPAHLSAACPIKRNWVYLLFTEWAWIFILWWVSKLWVARHIWSPNNIKLAKADNMFFAPLYDGVFLENSLMMNRVKKMLHEELGPLPTPMVKICATMWHEGIEEMESLIKSLCRLDMDQAKRAYCQERYGITDPDFYKFEGHIFFDDAIEKFKPGMKLEKGSSEVDFDQAGKRVNGFVRDLVTTVQQASVNYPVESSIRPPEKVETPYGGRLVWTLPGGNKIIAHLKDKALIKHKKRWSQVMYMYYFMGYELNVMKERDNLTSKDLQDKADYTFLLALDGDVDFEPKAVILLLDRMRRDNIVGAVCGRIHPIGSGPMVWYQKFEYALGHWLQKATEHVLGSVLCSPGCFSLFRGSAIMDCNVMKSYTHESTEARHHVQYDQGEDRWLCTLLLQQGWHVEYCAASDAFTQAPTGFEEFFKQRRRWMPSTMANVLDLLISWRSTIKRNAYVTFSYIAYQMLMFVLSLLGSGTIFLMLVDALSAAFSNLISPYVWLSVNLGLLILFVIVCFKAKEDNQIYLAAVLSTLYAVAQGVVLVSVIVNMAQQGPCSDTFIFFMLVAGVFLLAAIIHPKESFCVVHGLLYFFLVPSMYMLLMIYALINLNNVSWGVRETAPSSLDQAIERSEKQKAELQLQEQVAEATGLSRFLGLGVGGAGSESGWTLGVGGCCRFTCCPRPGAGDDLEAVLAAQSRLQTRVDTVSEAVSNISDRLWAPDGVPAVGVTREAWGPDSAPSNEDQQELQADPLPAPVPLPAVSPRRDPPPPEPQSCPLPSTWLADRRYLPPGDIDELPASERTFFEELIEKYLKPKVESDLGKEELKKELKDLRNKVAFSYLLMNIMFVVIVFTLKQLKVRIPWFCGGTIDPISLIFISFFGLILLLQTLGMVAHRFGTVVQVVANTHVIGREEARARGAINELFTAVGAAPLGPSRSDSTVSVGAPPPTARRRLTVVENSRYAQQLQRARALEGNQSLAAVFDRRVDRAVRAMDAKKHRKSILVTAPPAGHTSNSEEQSCNGDLA